MTNGQIHRKNLKDGSLSIIRFNSYAMSLSQFASAGIWTDYAPHERDTADLIHPDPNDKTFQTMPGWVRGELHRRLSEWLYPILFAYVALVVAGQTQSHRQTRFNTFFLGLGGALVYRWGAYAIYSANRTNGDLWWLFYALPLGGILLGIVMYHMGISVAVPDRIIRAWEAFNDRIRQMRIRAARARTA